MKSFSGAANDATFRSDENFGWTEFQIILEIARLNTPLIFAQSHLDWWQLSPTTFRAIMPTESDIFIGFKETSNIETIVVLTLWHLIVRPEKINNFKYKNCYCRWQEQKKNQNVSRDNKTNKYRNAVNRAHKSQFSINFMKQFLVQTEKHYWNCI